MPKYICNEPEDFVTYRKNYNIKLSEIEFREEFDFSALIDYLNEHSTDDPFYLSCLGDCYDQGYGVVQNRDNAISLYRKAAELDNPYAQFNLGRAYGLGDGIERNDIQAVYWYRKAAEQGNPKAQSNLGYHYTYGLGVEQDSLQAVYWYRKAAEQGHAIAQSNLASSYYNGMGTYHNKSQAFYWYQKAAEQGDAIAQCNLAACYENGSGVTKSKEQAIYWLKKAYENGYTECKDTIRELEEAILEQKNKLLKIPRDIDVFISWNHNDINLKNSIRDYLESNEIRVWESDKDCTGVLDESIKEAINRASTYLIILSENSFNSSYMPQEVTSIFNRLKDNEDMSEEFVKILVVNSVDKNNNVIFDVINHLNSQEKVFNELKPLSMVFNLVESEFIHILTYVKERLRDNQLTNYRKAIKDEFDVFSISLSEVIRSNENSLYKPSLTFENGYVNRVLYDSNNKEYSINELVTINGQVLIYGEGGTGKSLFIKNMIRTLSDKNNLYYYLPCSLITKFINDSNDIVDLISAISIDLFKCDRLHKEDIVKLFENENINFYVIIDALDELDKEETKEKLFGFIHKFQGKYYGKCIHFIYSSRNMNDSEYISKMTNKDVLSLELRKMNNSEIIQLFDNVFNRHNFRDNLPSKESFIESLESINDDIKNNPLLLSNLIYIYFVTKKPVTHKFELLDQSKKIMIDSLEEERNNSFNNDAKFKELGITIDDVLLEYAYDISNGIEKNTNELFKEYIISYCEEKNIQKSNNEIENYANEITKYLQRRKILIGNRMSHEIYSSYFAACFVYKNIYDVKKTVTKKKYIDFKDESILIEFITECLKNNKGLWPTVTVDFIAKLDYEMHCYNPENSEDYLSYRTFDTSLKQLLCSSGISQRAYEGLDKVVKKKILYFYEFISKYMNRPL